MYWYLKHYVRLKLIVDFGNKLHVVPWKSAREATPRTTAKTAPRTTPRTTAKTKYTECVHSITEIKFKLYVVSFKVCKYTGVIKKRMLEVIKKQRDANNLTLYCIVVLWVISVMNIFPHLIAPLKVWRSSTTFFEKRPNAPFSLLAFKMF